MGEAEPQAQLDGADLVRSGFVAPPEPPAWGSMEVLTINQMARVALLGLRGPLRRLVRPCSTSFLSASL